MALKATIYKATVNVADLDRNPVSRCLSDAGAPPFRNPGAYDAALAGVAEIC